MSTGEEENYRYELACIIDSGFLLDLSHEGSFGIGGAEGGVKSVHVRDEI